MQWKITYQFIIDCCNFIFLISLLEYNCFTMLCQFLLLLNKVNQFYVYIYPHIPSLLSLPPTLPIPLPRPSQSIKLISLCYAAAPTSHPFYIWQCIYVNPTLSLRPSFPFSPMSSSWFSMSASLFLPGNQVHHTIFLDSTYVCQYMVFVFLFLTYFTLYDRLQVYPPHYK